MKTFKDSSKERISQRENGFLDNIPNLHWFIHKEKFVECYIADLTHLVQNGENVANYYASAINHFAKITNRKDMFKASSMGGHNLLYFQGKAFKNFFKARNLKMPVVWNAPTELVMRLHDRTVCKINMHDRNNLNKLKDLKWFHVNENDTQFILSAVENGRNKLNHISYSINRLASVLGSETIKSSVCQKHSMLFLTSDAFEDIFKYLKQPKPSTELASETLKSHFAERRRIKKKSNNESYELNVFSVDDNEELEAGVDSSTATSQVDNLLADRPTIFFQYKPSGGIQSQPCHEIDPEEVNVRKNSISSLLNPLSR